MVETKRTLRIALAGNPNSGKTSVFNAMTGARQKVGNWPGVTVEKKVGMLSRRGYAIEVIDLPGTYSLTAFSVEERVARSFIVEEQPDVVIHVIDTGNLSRNLYLTVQLMELGVDLVLDLNMWDEFQASGAELDLEKLHRMMGAPVVPTVASRGDGIEELIDAAIDLAEDREEHHRHVPISYGPHVNDMLEDLVELLDEKGVSQNGAPTRWTAIKLLERDPEIIRPFLESETREAATVRDAVDRATRHIETATGSDAEKVISEGRYGYIEGALREAVTDQTTDRMEVSRRIDELLTNRFLGYPVFILLMWVLFQMTFRLGAYPMSWIESFVTWLATTLTSVLPESLLSSLLIDGVVGGVGSVIVFLPNILILFLGVAFLEDSGYMARGAFLMDRLMHSIGLHGKSFIPMLMGFGCSVPAIMATRTLESSRDRLLTALLVPLMSCSARLPVYLLIAGTFFAEQAGTVVFALYAIGVVIALLVGRLFSATLFRSAPAPFVMELPPYRMPTPRGLLVHMWERSKIYLQKMGGIILIASVILWFLGAFPQIPETTRDYEAEMARLESTGTAEAMERAEELENELAAKQIETSYIGQAGELVRPVVEPLGFTWEMGVSLVTGFVAKEVIVSTMGVLYQVGEEEGGTSLQEALRSPKSGVTPLSAFAFLIFVLLYTPCIAAVVAVKREIGVRWMWFSIGYQTALAWLMSFGVYRIGMLLGLG
ncbi:MAG: ferrous iron transport protein B [Candidatus Eisenbacteria bacterium]|nr:ferrous iron transport protein B [Candidatus Eisenbacteria bacterium]